MCSEQPYHFAHYHHDHTNFVADVLGHRARRDALLDKAARTANRDKRRLLIRQFLSDRLLKLLYLFESIQAKGLLAHFPPDRIQQIADEISASRHYFEPVRPVNLRSGSGNTRRTTYSFGPAKHALQRMVADLLKSMVPLPTDKHFTVNGGVRAALLAVEEHARNKFTFAIERDIAQFYPSVNVVELAKLLKPLPFSVVMNVIAYAPGFIWSEQHSSADAVHDAPLPLGGLLAQGSAASPIAAEVLMADLLQGMPDNVRILSYADNVLILGETSDSVEAADAVLENRASEHPCGPLRLKASNGITDMTAQGIHFLGNQGEWNGNGFDWEPSHYALEQVFSKIEQARDADEVCDTIRWLGNWRRGYPLWTNGDEETSLYRAQLGGRLAFLAPTSLSGFYIEGRRLVEDYCRAVYRRTGEFPSLRELLPDFHDNLQIEGRRQMFIRAIERRLGISADNDEANA